MIKFILNGGSVRKDKEKAKKFFSEILNGVNFQPRILFCFFAQKREYWEKYFSSYSVEFLEFFPKGYAPTFELAFPGKFEEQCRNVDIIFVHGGDDHLLLYWLSKFPLKKIWDGKIVVTSSAGSDAMVKHFWTCDWRECMNGLGILPIKFIPHFRSDFGDSDPRGSIDWDRAYKELETYGESLPICAIEEGDFAVFNID